jgi:hypothetical protein
MQVDESIHIVANIEDEVSWKESFLRNCCEKSISISGTINEKTAINLFIGDDIPWEQIYPNRSFIIAYFVAATSFNNLVGSGVRDREVELNNLTKADLIILPSHSVYMLLESAVEPKILQKCTVLGFPFNPLSVSGYSDRPKDNTVAFVTDFTSIKNFDFQLYLSKWLIKSGWSVTCYCSGKSLQVSVLSALGCTVVEKLSTVNFWKSCAKNKYFINVSKYESLSVSSIEAALLGCIVVCPDHSGFIDWCPPSNRFKEFTIRKVNLAIKNATLISIEQLSHYSSEFFFSKLRYLANAKYRELNSISSS